MELVCFFFMGIRGLKTIFSSFPIRKTRKKKISLRLELFFFFIR
jgi:hypothetical protein